MTDQKEDPLNANEEGPSKLSYVFPNGDRYEGECVRSECGALVRNGTGKHTSESGVIYQGDWFDDKMHGRGNLKHPSGAQYEGEFKDNMYQGMGTYTFPDGSVYKGDFHLNRFRGDATFVDQDQNMWKGEFHSLGAFGLKLQQHIQKQEELLDQNVINAVE